MYQVFKTLKKCFSGIKMLSLLSIGGWASAGLQPVFFDSASSGLSQWEHIDGAYTAKITSCPIVSGRVLSVGNEVIMAPLKGKLSDGVTLDFRAALNSEKRFLLIAITDKQGRIGLQAFYDSGAADGDAVVGIGKYSGLPEWRSVHNNVKGLAKKRISVLTNEMHHFVVTYDTQSSELNLRVDGKVIASLQSVEVDLSELTSLYVWGNNTAYIDYISVMSGVPVVE